MADDEEDERHIELSALAAIFPEIKVERDGTSFKASLDLDVSPVKPWRVRFATAAPGRNAMAFPTPPNSDESAEAAEENDADTSQPEGDGAPRQEKQLSHMPPLHLHFILPPDYPATAPPTIFISTLPAWLDDKIIKRLVADSREIWEQLGRDQIIFSYIDHLQQAADDVFGLHAAEGEDPATLPRGLEIALLDFDIKKKQERFNQGTFNCQVCLEPKKGSVCHRFQGCGHVFCTECVQKCFDNCITEGNVSSVKCLAVGCGKERKDVSQVRKRLKKEDGTIQPSELLQIPISQEQVKRYVELKRKAEIESNKNTIYCPRKWCQGAARIQGSPKVTCGDDSGSESDDEEPPQSSYVWKVGDPWDAAPSPGERLAICDDCSYAFCRCCEHGWHGEYRACFVRNPAEISAEEAATRKYLNAHSTKCPTCDAPCQKAHGCNHMVCCRCQTHFCYLCSSWLSADNPYKHFNNSAGQCFMKLWELEDGEQAELNGPVAQARVPAPARRPQVNELPQQRQARLAFQQREAARAEADAAAAPGDAPDARNPPEAPAPPAAARPPARVLAARREEVEVIFVDDAANLRRRAGEMARPEWAVPRDARRGDARRLPDRPRPPALGAGGVGRREGLARFLDMIERDEEDDWDSDELSDEEGHFEEFR